MDFTCLVAPESGNSEFAASLLGPSAQTPSWRARFKEVRPTGLALMPSWTPPHTRAPGCGGPDYREGLGSDRRGRSRPLKPRRRRHPCGGADGAGGGRTGDIPLGKQTLCQLSYSRSGGPDCSGPPSRRQRAARAIRPRPGLAVARAYDGQHGCAARTVSPTGVSPPGDPHRTCQTRLIATRRTGALWARCPHRER